MELFSNYYIIKDTDDITVTGFIDDNNSKDYRVGGGEMCGKMLQVNAEKAKSSCLKRPMHTLIQIKDAAGEIVQHTKIQGCIRSMI